MRIFTLTKSGFRLIVGIIMLLTITISCVKEKDFNFDMMAQNQYESEWAVPIINARYQLGDFVLDSMDFIQTDPTNQFLTVIYNTGDIWSVSAEDMISLPDESIDKTENVPAPSSVPSGSFWEANYSTQVGLNMNSYSVDTLLLKAGSFITAINTNINHPALVTVTVPSAVDQNGAPLSFLIDMTDLSGSGTASGSTTINLTGYKFTIETGNKLTVNYKVKVLGDGNPFTIPTYNVNVNTQLKDLKYKYMIGYFGQLTQNLIDTASIRLFSQNYENSLYLKDFRAHLFMKNSFGIPLSFRVNSYTIYNSNQTINVITPGYTVDGPYPTLAEFGQTITKHDTAILNPSMLEISPKYQAFNATGILNPANNPSIKNFVRDDSKFSVDARLELPMEGKISYLRYKDTLEFHFDNIDAIDYTNFRLYVENAFPIDGWMQVYFADTNYVITDSLITNPQEKVFAAATIGPAPNYYTISNGIATKNFIVSHDRITRMANVKYLIVNASLSSKPDGQFIRLYGNQYVSVILGTRVKIKANY
jgi:hypothetical protein